MTTRKKKATRTSAPEPRLYPYQRRWVEDESRFKIACKARQIGFSFVAAWRVVDKRTKEPGLTVWLSASERQALEAMEHIRRFCRELKVAAVYEESFVEETLVKQHQVRFANGSRIVALPANPDTVRGFAGDVVLDEFAFHRDADAIWRAAFATATRGFQIEIISTPNGARGKYYELAREAGLVDFEPLASGSEEFRGAGSIPPPPMSHESRATSYESRVTSHGSLWSPHWVDLPTARAQGFVVDVESLRAAIADEDAWQQEYCCRFLAEAAHYIPPEMVVAAEHPAATTSLPSLAGLVTPSGARRAESRGLLFEQAGSSLVLGMRERFVEPNGPPHWEQASQESRGQLRSGSATGQSESVQVIPATSHELPVTSHCFLGVDIGRRRDLTVLWLLEVENERAPADARSYLTRAVLTLERQPFAAQRQALDALLTLRAEQNENRSRTFGTKLEARGEGSSFGFRVSSFVVQRCAIDATGLGAMLAEELQTRWGARVEPVTFTLAVKEDLAVRVKRMLEERRLKLPYDPAVRAALNAVKRYVTPAGNIRFDAERTERAPHADHFWALALALAAAEESGASTEFLSSRALQPSAQSFAF